MLSYILKNTYMYMPKKIVKTQIGLLLQGRRSLIRFYTVCLSLSGYELDNLGSFMQTKHLCALIQI